MGNDFGNIFAAMFAKQKEEQKEESVSAAPEETVKPNEPSVAVETKAETPTEDPTKEKTEKSESEANEPSEDEGADPKIIEKAKKELGEGGASFCDELLTVVPDALSRLRRSGKTLHGLFNFSYSYALDEYVKKNGKVSGGGYYDTAFLLEKYLDPEVKEGFVIEEPKPKKSTYTPPPVSNGDAANTIVKTAKRAARSAKKSTKKEKVATLTPEQEKANIDEVNEINAKFKDAFKNIDFSSMFKKG